MTRLRRLWQLWAAGSLLWVLYCGVRVAGNLDKLVFFDAADMPGVVVNTTLDILGYPAFAALPLLAVTLGVMVARRLRHPAGQPPIATA